MPRSEDADAKGRMANSYENTTERRSTEVLRQGALLCPLCGSDHTHIDVALVSGRPREDGPVIPVRVDSAGKVYSGGAVPVASDRRHAIGLQGSCENCHGEFVIQFSQHKGQTLTTVLPQLWEATAEVAGGE